MKKRILLLYMTLLVLGLSVIPTQVSHALTLSTGIIIGDNVAL